MVDQQQPPYNTPQASPPVVSVEPHTPSPEESKQELQEAVLGSNQVLATATTTLSLFPDTVTLDRAKLTITKRTFFRASEVMSIRIEDVLNVTATLGPVFGRIKLTSRIFNTEKPFVVGQFWRKDAIRLKHITQGYIIALQRNIDCSSLPTYELVSMLDKLGEDDHHV